MHYIDLCRRSRIIERRYTLALSDAPQVKARGDRLCICGTALRINPTNVRAPGARRWMSPRRRPIKENFSYGRWGDWRRRRRPGGARSMGLVIC